MSRLSDIRDHVISMLDTGLSKRLTYHCIDHTLDVSVQCLAIAREEGITDQQKLLELEVAALYHDTGFIFIYQKHEERGCEIARDQLPGFGFDQQAIDSICELIMATKVPQQPANHLQQIICDADLDYLGRDDFFEIGDKLRRELIEYNFLANEHDWEETQINFLRSHRYFTTSSREKREPVKMEFIKQLMQNRNIKAK